MPFKDKPQRHSRKKLIILGLVGLLLIAGAGLAYSQYRAHKHLPVATAPAQKINKAPATAVEKQDSQDSKDRIVEQNKAAATPATGKKAVTPIITHTEVSAADVTAEGFVPGIVESSGSCTLTATQGSATVTKKSGVTPNANTTNCQAIHIPRSEFPASGVWSLVIRYDSDKAAGSSEATSVTL